MNRFLLGIAAGAALVYFFDAEHGENRRMKASNWVSQYVNADTMQQARQATQATMQQARQATQSTMQQARSLTGQMSDQVNQLRSGRRSSSAATSDSLATDNATRTPAGTQS